VLLKGGTAVVGKSIDFGGRKSTRSGSKELVKRGRRKNLIRRVEKEPEPEKRAVRQISRRNRGGAAELRGLEQNREIGETKTNPPR